MSFILDALRKSDQQRQRSVTPTLMMAQTPAAQPRQPALWWYGLLAAVLIGAGVLIGWMHQWQSESAAPAISSGAGRPIESDAQKFTPAPLAAVTETPRKPDNQPPAREANTPTQTAPPPSVAVAPRDNSAKPEVTGQQPVAIVPSQTVAAAPAQELHPATGQGDTPRESGVMVLTQLPSALQQEIPKLSILAHAYSSKPKDRFVFINDRMWREEEYPVPGLKLEQITADGMIFSYKGYRFRRGTNP